MEGRHAIPLGRRRLPALLCNAICIHAIQLASRIHALEIRSEGGKEFIYAARPSDHEVVKIDLEGKEIWKITTPAEAGIYKEKVSFNPCAVTVAPDGSIYVADGYGSNFVLKFDKNRKFVKAFGGPGEPRDHRDRCALRR